jgi:hypothetical protein
MNYLQLPQLDLPLGLISRLVLVDRVFVDQFVQSVNSRQVRMMKNANITYAGIGWIVD